MMSFKVLKFALNIVWVVWICLVLKPGAPMRIGIMSGLEEQQLCLWMPAGFRDAHHFQRKVTAFESVSLCFMHTPSLGFRRPRPKHVGANPKLMCHTA